MPERPSTPGLVRVQVWRAPASVVVAAATRGLWFTPSRLTPSACHVWMCSVQPTRFAEHLLRARCVHVLGTHKGLCPSSAAWRGIGNQ